MSSKSYSGLPSGFHVEMGDAKEDRLCRAISSDGFVSVKALDCTSMVREVCRRQGCGRVAATALGRALGSVVLIADGIQDEETFQVRFEGTGPLGGLLAVSNGRLEARGYCGNPTVEGSGSIGDFIGPGTLKVVRLKNLPGEDVASPFSSIVDIVSGEIAQDINHYVATSEQREGALAAGVAVGEENDVTAAGGWRIELLPEAPGDVADHVLSNVDSVLSAGISTTDLLQAGATPDDIVARLFTGMDFQLLEPAKPTFKCTCSDARVFRTLALLPRNEVNDILRNHEKIEAKCEFCGTVYSLTPDKIRSRLAKVDAAN